MECPGAFAASSAGAQPYQLRPAGPHSQW